MKKKNWAKLLTIAISLILCIVSTFGLTLAFFGGNASANLSTITLKTGIEIGAAIKSSVGEAKVVPGQPVKIEATGTLKVTDKGTPTSANAVDGVVRAKLTVGDELGDVTISGEGDYWTAGGDGYYYLVTEENGTTLRVVKVGDSVKLFGNLVVNKNFTNADSGKSVEASVIFETIQAGVYDSVNGGLVEMTVASATYMSSPLYSAFSAVKINEKYNVKVIIDNSGAENSNYGIDIQFDNDEVYEHEGWTGDYTYEGYCSTVTFYGQSIIEATTPAVTAPGMFVPDPISGDDYYCFYTEQGGDLLFKIQNTPGAGYSQYDYVGKTIVLTKDTTFYVTIVNENRTPEIV